MSTIGGQEVIKRKILSALFLDDPVDAEIEKRLCILYTY